MVKRWAGFNNGRQYPLPYFKHLWLPKCVHQGIGYHWPLLAPARLFIYLSHRMVDPVITVYRHDQNQIFSFTRCLMIQFIIKSITKLRNPFVDNNFLRPSRSETSFHIIPRISVYKRNCQSGHLCWVMTKTFREVALSTYYLLQKYIT